MAGATTHILRASLRPKLYRDIEIDSEKSLYDLAEGIVRAFVPWLLLPGRFDPVEAPHLFLHPTPLPMTRNTVMRDHSR